MVFARSQDVMNRIIQGGGLALAFGTRTSPPPEPETLALLSGVIASSPLLLQTHPASKLLRYIGGKVSVLFPHLLFDAPIPVEHWLNNEQAQQDMQYSIKAYKNVTNLEDTEQKSVDIIVERLKGLQYPTPWLSRKDKHEDLSQVYDPYNPNANSNPP